MTNGPRSSVKTALLDPAFLRQSEIDRKEEEMASLATRLKLAVEESEASTPRTGGTVPTSCYRASGFIAVLLAVAAGAGLLLDVYRDNEWVSSQMRGQDFVSLVFGLPLLVVSAHFARKGSIRGLLVWLGALAYVTYAYLYIFGIAWNELFLVYLALMVTSAFTLISALVALDPLAIREHFDRSAPTRSVGRFLYFFAVVLGLMWGIQAVVATMTGDVPKSVTSSGHPTAVVFILDLGLVVPLFVVGSRLLSRGKPWGFVAAGVLLVKSIAEGLALLGMSMFMYLADHPDYDVALVPLWGLVAAASTYLTIRFYGSIHPINASTMVEGS
jgi:hypothetical protein